MERVVTAQEMRELDRYTISQMGIPSCVLMERAALAAAQEIKSRISEDEDKILVVCGPGNNGGDGIALARILDQWGYSVDIFLSADPGHMSEEAGRQAEIARHYLISFKKYPNWNDYTVIVDALFGVGLSREVEGEKKKLLERMNQAQALKVALDMPSGVDSDTGKVLGIAFRADITVTFGFLKRGLCLFPGRELAGEILVRDVGITDTLEVKRCGLALSREDLMLLPQRSLTGNKGTFGKVLAVAGSPGMCGAAYLCAAAAFAAGAGMVMILTSEENRIPLQCLLPEAMVKVSSNEKDWEDLAGWCDVLILGPGLGTDPESVKKAEWFLSYAWKYKKPTVLDADGLNIISENPRLKTYLGNHAVLTPHPGEMKRLTGKSIKEITEDPAGAAVELSRETGAVCVLKGPCTVTADRDRFVYFNRHGNPGMATAGSGDVLSGVMAGVFCMYLNGSGRNQSSGMKAALAVLLHALAGDRAAAKKGERGMKAGDIIEAVAEELRDAGREGDTR